MLTDYHFVEQNVHFQMGFAQYKIATTSLSSSVQLNIHFKRGIGIFVVNELNSTCEFKNTKTVSFKIPCFEMSLFPEIISNMRLQLPLGIDSCLQRCYQIENDFSFFF